MLKSFMRCRPVISVVIAVTTIACTNREAARAEYLRQGDSAFNESRFAEAVIAYKNALTGDPLYGPAREKLAEAYARAGDFPAAAREYVRFADLSAKDSAVQVKAARYLLFSGQFEDAAARARNAIELEPGNAEAHVTLGHALAATRDLDAAIDQLEEAIKLDPTEARGYSNLGGVLMAQGKRAEARSSFETAVKFAPKSVSAHLALGTYHLSVGDIAAAEASVRAALAVAPGSAQANRAMAALLMSSGRSADAEPYLKATVAALGKPEAELALAEYYLSVKKTDLAKAIWERLSTASSEWLSATANTRFAAVEYTEGRKAEAHNRLDGVLKRSGGHEEATILKGQWLLAEGDIAGGTQLASAAVNANPRSAGAQFLLGRAMFLSGDRQKAGEAFAEVLRLNPRAVAAQRELARLNLAVGKTEAGVQFAREAVNQDPRDGDARVLLVRGLLTRGEVDRAEAELVPLMREHSDDPRVRAMHGMLLLSKRDYPGARRDFEQALQRNPAHLDALTGLTSLEVRTGDVQKARNRLSVQLASTPNDPALLLLAAQTDLDAKDYSLGERRLRRVIELDASNLTAYGQLAQLYLRQQRLDDARQEFERIASKTLRPVAALTFIGISFDVQNRPEEAQRAYRRALDVDGGAAVAANNLAFHYAQANRDLEAALALARMAAEKLRDEPSVLDTLGWVLYKKDQHEKAIVQFEQCTRLAPDNPHYWYHLGLAYWKAGEDTKSRRALSEALKLNASFDGAAEARKVLASLQAQ